MKGFISIHDKKGTYLYCSDKISSITGDIPDSYIGNNAYEYFQEEDKLNIMMHHLNSLADNSFYNKEYVTYRIKNKNSWTWVKSFSFPYEDLLVVYTRKLTLAELIKLKAIILLKKLGLL